ncbi:MAG: methyltransferase [Pararhodobacter sp.]|nr:methyltransferase [Pararhodobacter sp.]
MNNQDSQAGAAICEFFPAAALRQDAFLGGALAVWQPLAGYRAATDPVLLAAAVPALARHSALELGCGAGVALLALGRRVAGLRLAGVERQPAYADLARRNAAQNAIAAEIVTADLTGLPPALRTRSFDHVLMNPPYFAPGDPAARDAGRDSAQREQTPLAEWIDCALRRLKPGGHLTLIHRAERLPAILATLDGRAAATVRPLAARQGRAAGRVLVLARKGARSPFRLLAPLVMHEGPAHPGDHDHFTATANAVLREMAPLAWR